MQNLGHAANVFDIKCHNTLSSLYFSIAVYFNIVVITGNKSK